MKNYNMSLFCLTNSPWPLVLSLSILIMMVNFINYIFLMKMNFILSSFILVLMNMILWWNDVIKESSLFGNHNYYILLFTTNSMIMFIISEIFFFISFFWTFFYSMFSPDIFIGSNWPSVGIVSINFMNLPLFNSILLISSGCSVTWSHYKILSNKINKSKKSLFLTVILGLMFIFCQLIEYNISNFCFSDSIYGSIFFISTGFHGIHVLIGTLFLFIILIRMNMNQFSTDHLMGFEFSIWYWHFVDVVWLYLYLMVYWLGS